jgi:deglycase
MGEERADDEVLVEAGFVTSFEPDDLPAFGAKVVEENCMGRHEEQALQTADAG